MGSGMKRTLMALVLSVLLAFGIAFVVPPKPAQAVNSDELQAQLDEAKARLEELASEVADAGELLQDTQYELEQTQAKIEETEGKIEAKQDEITQTEAEIEETRAQIAEAQEILGNRISSSYKAGPVNFLSIVLSSTSFEDFISRVYYADAVNQSDAEQIDEIKALKAELEEKEEQLEQQKAELEEDKAELEEQEAEQEQLVAEAESRKAELEAKEAEQSAYVDSLDEELQAKLEEERQAELERQRQAAAAAAAAAQQQAQAAAAQQADSTDDSSSDTSSDTSSSSGPSYDYDEDTTYSSGGGLTGDQRAAIVSAAYSQLGVPYSLGAYSPGSLLDCSGLTKYCYACAGISIPHSSAAQRGISSSKPRSAWEPGDLIFWYGHVAVYVGDGMMIHANGRYVSYTEVTNSYIGGGTPYA